MSLVAYGSSGDEESDEEVQNNQDDVKSPSLIVEKRDPGRGKGMVLPNPTQERNISNSSTSLSGKTRLSSFLPKPKNASNLEREGVDSHGFSDNKNLPISLEGTLDDEEILEIEEEYEPIAKRAKKVDSAVGGGEKLRSVGSLFSLLPAPWKADSTWQTKKKDSKAPVAEDKKLKQTVKISIPTAPKNDSDEEDDMPAVKKVGPSKGGSGLKALLPKPKHSITRKADNPNKPAVKLASRPLIPHTLTKKPTPALEKTQKPLKRKQDEETGSDDEDEPFSFFTFDDKIEIKTDEKVQTFQSEDTESKTCSNVAAVERPNPLLLSLSQDQIPSSKNISQSRAKHVDEASHPVVDDTNTWATFSSEGVPSQEELETKTYYYEPQSGQSQEYGGYSAVGDSYYTNYNYDASSSASHPYYGQETESYTHMHPTSAAGGVQCQGSQADQTRLDLEKMKKLKGRRNRGEEINIVDINADDQIGNSAEMLTKYGTEEITYAPSRAKERELELRQQWSANRQTRRQTQSKYGF
ncbi:proline-rich protein PRCC-like [Stylophora pistillata]|uniref:proline-rich protein PRCC-like n=1 Tax=Stylophora pistillata TaxID=50429 RepID=UPI000C04CD0B|nr:proline-rich protein PRCC-like [Stylophora pistillata]